jgi:hypothetical protein
VTGGQLTHVEKRTPVQRSPGNLPLLPQLRKILSCSHLCAYSRFRKPSILLARHVAHKLVCEEEFHACGDGGVNDELRGYVLCCGARDAVYDCVLAAEGFCEGEEGCVVDGGVGGVAVGGRSVGGGWAGDCCYADVGGVFEGCDDGGADVAASLRVVSIGSVMCDSERTPRIAMVLSSILMFVDCFVAAGRAIDDEHCQTSNFTTLPHLYVCES